jgi:hypothetical protein
LEIMAARGSASSVQRSVYEPACRVSPLLVYLRFSVKNSGHLHVPIKSPHAVALVAPDYPEIRVARADNVLRGRLKYQSHTERTSHSVVSLLRS